MDGYTAAIRKYAQFSGRSRRREYWSFMIVNAIIGTVLYTLMLTIGANEDGGFNAIGTVLIVVIVLYALFILIPHLAVQWRRYQDIGWAGPVSIVGWFIPLLTFIVAFIPSNPGPNQYGADPKA